MLMVLLFIKWLCDELSIFCLEFPFVFTSQNPSIIFIKCTCRAVIRLDVDPILRTNCSTLPVIHILCFICFKFSYGLQKLQCFCPEVVIRYMIIGSFLPERYWHF